MSAACLQSPDDLEATYREKRGEGYQGYVANVSETCNPENKLQLITKVQVAPNNRDDGWADIKTLDSKGVIDFPFSVILKASWRKGKHIM